MGVPKRLFFRLFACRGWACCRVLDGQTKRQNCQHNDVNGANSDSNLVQFHDPCKTGNRSGFGFIPCLMSHRIWASFSASANVQVL